MANNPNANPLNQLNNMHGNNSQNGQTTDDYLRSIDNRLAQLLQNGLNTSASNAANQLGGGSGRSSNFGGDRRRNRAGGNPNDRYSQGDFDFESVFKQFGKALSDSLMKDSPAKKFSRSLDKSLENLSKAIGVEIDDLPKAYADYFGDKLKGLFDKVTSKGPAKRLRDIYDKSMSDFASSFEAEFDKAMAASGDSRTWQSLQEAAERQNSKNQVNGGGGGGSPFGGNRGLNRGGNNPLGGIGGLGGALSNPPGLNQGSGIASQSATQVMDVRLVSATPNGSWYVPVKDFDKSADSAFDQQSKDDQSMKDKAQELRDKLQNRNRNSTDVDNSQRRLQRRNASGSKNNLISGAGKKGVSNVIGSTIKAFGKSVMKLIPGLGILGIATAALSLIIDKAMVVIKRLFAWFDQLGKAANRAEESDEKNRELAKQRIKDDIESYIKAPFEILKSAAQEVYNAWDQAVRVINATQGYNKSDLQDLMAVYADRIRSENLTSVVSGTSIITNLEKVLQAGLTGKAAEEFAYQASVLNAAVPTQDFFQYVDTYAAMIAQEVANGKSQSAATASATEQLKALASNVLYVNRQLTGGLSVGLKDASSLFESAFKIAQSARIGNAVNIGSVLAAVQGITGSIAPDLASSITQLVVEAATGGNADAIVALRSMAGVNASNTEFLKMIAQNPQQLFVNMFRGLGKLQAYSSEAFAERAEGLSSIFNVSMESLLRVDFNYLADQISRMNISSDSLDENMRLLREGQTTTNAEQLKMQQINKYMLDEGLAYVLDNEVARSIQEHMWQEQIAREMQETTYGVELVGSSMDLLSGLRDFIELIVNFLNPFFWIEKAANIFKSQQDYDYLRKDIKQMLELGKVGEGNAQQLHNLTTENENLRLTSQLVDLMGGKSNYASGSVKLNPLSFRDQNMWNNLSDPTNPWSAITSKLQQPDTIANAVSGPSSQYRWGSLGKSAATALSGINGYNAQLKGLSAIPGSNEANSKNSQLSALEKMLSEDYMKEYTKLDPNTHKPVGTYEQWRASAGKAGVKDFSKTVQEAGLTEDELKTRFMSSQAQQKNEEDLRKSNKEELFWDKSMEFYELTLEWQQKLLNTVDYGLINGGIAADVAGTPRIQLFQEHVEKITDELIKKNTDEIKRYIKGWESYYLNTSSYRASFGLISDSVWQNSLSYATSNKSSNPSNPFDMTDMVNDLKRRSSSDSRLNTTFWSASDMYKLQQQDQTLGEEARMYLLADTLTTALKQTSDPVAQTNALLAQILVVVNAIMQQNNKVGGLSLADSLVAQATGQIRQTG